MASFNSWMAKWRKFLRLPAAERGLLIHAFLLLSLIPIFLRLMSFRRTYSALASGLRPPLVTPNEAERTALVLRTCAQVRLVASVCPLQASCLPRSLVLWRLLQQQGIGCDLRVGVRLRDGQFEAHAWVEYGGQSLDIPGVEGDFAPFVTSLTPVARPRTQGASLHGEGEVPEGSSGPEVDRILAAPATLRRTDDSPER